MALGLGREQKKKNILTNNGLPTGVERYWCNYAAQID